MNSAWWDKIKNTFANIEATAIGKTFLHILLVGIICFAGYVGFQISVKNVEKDSEPWIKLIADTKVPGVEVCKRLEIRLGNKIEANSKAGGNVDSAKTKEIRTAQCERLIEQMRYVKTRIELHSALMKYLYTRMFAALITALGAGLLAMMVLVFVTREGWKDTSTYLLAAFLALSVVTGFYGTFPTMFEQKKNAEANKELCVAYDAILHDIKDYFVIIPEKNEKSIGIENFILSISQRITKLRSLPISMNPEEAVTLSQKVRKIVEEQARSGQGK